MQCGHLADGLFLGEGMLRLNQPRLSSGTLHSNFALLQVPGGRLDSVTIAHLTALGHGIRIPPPPSRPGGSVVRNWNKIRISSIDKRSFSIYNYSLFLALRVEQDV